MALAANASIVATNDDDRAFPCTIPGCSKAYRRNEHLLRHLRSHRLQKPFDCLVCHKNYGRQDVLKRHVASQHSAVNSSHRARRRRRRATSACDRCHSRKAACSGDMPCQACLRSNSFCQYSRNVPQPIVAPDLACFSLQGQPTSDGCSEVIDDLLFAEQRRHAVSRPADMPRCSEADPIGSVVTLNSNERLWEALEGPECQLSLGHQPDSGQFDHQLISQPVYVVEQVAQNVETTLQTSINPECPWATTSAASDSCQAIAAVVTSTDETSHPNGSFSRLGHDVTPLDSAEHLSRSELPVDANVPSLHLDMQPLDCISDSALHGVSVFPLSAQDTWLPAPSSIFSSTVPFSPVSAGLDLPRLPDTDTWALANVRPQSGHSDTEPRAAAPSLFPLGSRALEHCIDTFFSKFHRLWPTVHRGTFNPDAGCQDLVDSIAMIGAWESGIASWMDVSLRIHRSIMETLREKFFDSSSEQDEGLRWPISTYQTLLLNAVFALQISDDKRFSKAYLHHSMMLSVFREAGLFNEQYNLARDDRENAIPFSWLRRETLKRLAYFAFRLDIYYYFLRGYRPMLRYDELCLTLPCSERLWEAQTAEEWRKVKLLESKKRNPMHFMHLVDQILDQEGHAALPPLLEDEYMYGLCAMQAWLWQDAHRHRSRTESGRTLSSIQAKAPAGFSQSADFWAKQLTIWREGYRDRALGASLSSKDHREMLENSAMPLYHLSQIVLTANVEAIKELSMDQRLRPCSGTFRRQLESSTLGWALTSDARLAIWHAAKVLKLLQDKVSRKGTQGDAPSTVPHIGLIASIALYEAGLVVWAYARSVQVCDACPVGSSLHDSGADLEPFELFGMEEDDSFGQWLEYGGRGLIDGHVLCACNLSRLISLYEATLLRCGSQWCCVSQMARSLSRLKQGD